MSDAGSDEGNAGNTAAASPLLPTNSDSVTVQITPSKTEDGLNSGGAPTPQHNAEAEDLAIRKVLISKVPKFAEKKVQK